MMHDKKKNVIQQAGAKNDQLRAVYFLSKISAFLVLKYSLLREYIFFFFNVNLVNSNSVFHINTRIIQNYK